MGPQDSTTNTDSADARERIAIIGIGCRLPGGAGDHRTFWRNLIEGRDCLTPTPADRYDVATLGSRDRAKPGRLVGGRGGYIDGFDEFEPAFFGISPREAEHMDPQQRKLLEVSWEALEDGGQRPAALAGREVGVFIGAFTLDYKILQFADLGFESLAAHTATGTMMTMVSNRISHCFDFRGPSISLDTACSSSLVAVHLACQSLLRGESELALAGGTLLHMAPQYTIAETKGGFLSAEGRSRTFDASADGYVRAEGVGVVVLKRLADALRDGDRVHAVVIGSGVNQDGRTNGITVPSPDAQVALIERVCAEAGVSPGSLQYVEAHGTSTPVGDPLEAAALGRALSLGREPGAKCYVGSVKTNIGHTEAAAGVAGLIKTVLCLKHQRIPPHINLEQISPDIDLASLPFEIPTRPTDWPEHQGPARAGVNAFGFGGTNAHILLEQAPEQASEQAPEQVSDQAGAAPAESGTVTVLPLTVLPLTAREPAALPELADRLRQELADSTTSLTDLGWTLAHRRQHLPARLSVVYSSRASLDEALAAAVRGEPHPRLLSGRQRESQERGLVWVFTGVGPQWWAMGRQLFTTEAVYREAIERCDQEIRRQTGWSLIAELQADEADSRMGEPWLAQPANFALQVGLAALWRSYGVRPDAVVGHSTGEVAAFHEAGVYSLADAVKVTVHRSRLQQRLVGTGTMLAVNLSEAQAGRRVRPCGERVSVAAVNSPTSVTLAGDREALARLAAELAADDLFAKFLAVEVPYHSARMAPIKEELLASLEGLKPDRAQLPLYLTGREGTALGPELDAAYWWTNVREPVRFRAAVDRLVDDGHRLFLEIGPHPVLSAAIVQNLAAKGVEGTALPSIRRHEDEPERFALSLASLHNLGVDLDWRRLHPVGRPVTLPPYPWRRDRYWAEPASVAQVRLGRVDHPLLGRRTAGVEPVWEARIDTEALPYLDDHRIQGSVVFPAAGYLEMAAQAVRAMTGSSRAVLADVEFRKALFLPDDGVRTVQFSFAPESAAFTVATADSGERAVHAQGVVRAGQRLSLGAPLDPEAAVARCARRLDGPACYAALARLGYHYGPAFQGIEEVWIGRDEALARIRPPASLGSDPAGHHVHPAVLDSCFQALLTARLPDGQAQGQPDGQADEPGGQPGGPPDFASTEEPRGMLLPLSVAEVRLEPVGDRPLWVHTRISRREGAELVGEISLYEDGGRPLGRISGFRAADIEQTQAAVALGTIDGWLSEPTWTQLPGLGQQSGELPDVTGAGWLLLADASGVADELAALLTARGAHCHLVRPGAEFRTGARDSTIGSLADLAPLLTELGRAERPFDTVVHLWNLDLPTLGAAVPARFAEYTGHGSYSLVALAQALPAALPGSRLHIVTRGSQAAADGDRVEPLGAPAWGVARVLWYQELTAHRGKLVDLESAGGTDPAADRSAAEALLRELLVDDEPELALRGGRRLACRLTPPAGLTRPLPLRLRADGSYLVTGAFGALGQVLCRALARRGARRLILVGRSALPERGSWSGLDPDSPAARAVRLVRELEALGAQPIPVRLEITDEAGLTAWLAEYRRTGQPPIRGVFHLAGQVDDTLVADLDRTRFDAVHDPKTVGACLLHRLLPAEPIEHFVLFASLASLLTTAGQANYAAGNAFLDALAQHRRALGLPALSLDWGPWATGMIEELGLIDHYRDSRGMSPLSPQVGTAVLERVIGQEHAQLVVAPIVNWSVFLAWYDSPLPLVAELALEDGPSAQEQSGFLEEFREADEAGRRLLAARMLTALAAGVLHLPPGQLGPEAGLTALGLDSLLAMELRARLQTELKVTLPVVALLGSAPLGRLAEQVHDALASRLAAGAAGADGGPAVELFSDEQQYPLTQNQKALWFLKQLHPDSFAYNIGGAVEVRTEIDPELMFEAFRVLLARHPSLRANFLLEKGQPVQRICADPVPDLALFDVREQEWESIRALIVREYRKPYQLESDPLVRFRLFQRGPDHWVIMKAVHHIVSDAISTFTFIEELLAVHQALREGRGVDLPPVPARYLDFLNRQNRFLAGPDARRMLDYWRGRLPAEIPVLSLPTDKPRPAVQTHNGASEFFLLDAELSGRVHALAREHGVTVFMVLLSAYYLLLHRYSGQDEVIVGSPVAGRTEEELASVYGYFVNPLPLHVSLAGEPTVSELLARVRETVLGGLDHQEYPFVLLVEQLGLRHDPSRSAVFQAMFILLTHKVATEKYGYRLEYIELPEEEGQFDLTLSVYEDEADQRFHCVLKYNTDLYLPESVQRLAAHYTNLVDALTRATATEPVGRLELLGSRERAVILDEWSGAGRRVSPDLPVHELILRSAAEQPAAVAVVAPSTSGATRRLSYAELATGSGRLADRLRARGAGAGTVVGVCLEKSPELITALLAVLRTGAAYLPLDPSHPVDRLRALVGNAGATLVVTGTDAQSSDLAELPAEILALADPPAPDTAPRHAATAPADPPVDLDSPAYLIHTSGSTGRPKAVQISHRNLASAYGAWREEYRLDTDVRVHLQLAAPSFDVFTGDLVRALCSGGTLVLADRDLLFDTARLYETMRTERVDCAEFVPAVLRPLLAHCERTGHRLDFMRLLIVGSDVWRVEEHRRLHRLAGPRTRLVNSYGLTEATVDSAYYEGAAEVLEATRMVPIGRPFPNSALYILDEHRQPVPPGVPGELWVGGEGVAIGYTDPAQTEERFVTVALGGEPLRLYRTGDLAHWDGGGGLHLLGRLDRQVKVRGHRVEVGEIEAQLSHRPGLTAAVVTARQDDSGESVLCAYCVPGPRSALNAGELRRQLARTLPSFMIPAHFVELAELPLTPNGKVDLAALPAPRSVDTRAFEPPVTPYEVRMADHWQRLLGLEQVGLQHDFFEVGGSSVRLIELIHELRTEFGFSIPVSLLFRATTLSGMAATVEQLAAGRGGDTRPCLHFNTGAATAHAPLFAFPPAGGHGLVYRQLAEHLDDFEVIAFNYLAGDDKTARYADLVESLQSDGPCTLFGYSLGGNLAFEVARELEDRGREVAHVLIMDSYRIPESFTVTDEHLSAFERELGAHLHQHTGSEIVAQETLDQARDYLDFCGRTPNLATLTAPVSVISDVPKLALYAQGRQGSWHGSSLGGAELHRGFGVHAEMLDREYLAPNAGLVRAILTGVGARGA